jgi:hypothetical protein
MIRIAITQAAFAAIAKTLPVGSVAYEPAVAEGGLRYIWLEARWLDRLKSYRGPGEIQRRRYITALQQLTREGGWQSDRLSTRLRGPHPPRFVRSSRHGSRSAKAGSSRVNRFSSSAPTRWTVDGARSNRAARRECCGDGLQITPMLIPPNLLAPPTTRPLRSCSPPSYPLSRSAQSGRRLRRRSEMLGATLPGLIPDLVPVLVEDQRRIGLRNSPGA